MEDNAPRTEADWQRVEHEAIRLLIAALATRLGGSENGVTKMAEEQQWIKSSQEMTEIGRIILQTARDKDYEAVLDAGNRLIEPCSACHAAFPVDAQQ
ncbi:MAG: hypothetical protein WDZ30_06180 [Cellvibrionaceae bacterium]